MSSQASLCKQALCLGTNTSLGHINSSLPPLPGPTPPVPGRAGSACAERAPRGARPPRICVVVLPRATRGQRLLQGGSSTPSGDVTLPATAHAHDVTGPHRVPDLSLPTLTPPPNPPLPQCLGPGHVLGMEAGMAGGEGGAQGMMGISFSCLMALLEEPSGAAEGLVRCSSAGDIINHALAAHWPKRYPGQPSS